MVGLRNICINTLHKGGSDVLVIIPEQHPKKARNEITTKNCTQITESANVKVQNRFHGQNNVTCSTNCK
jgi:hypothetical protein